MPFDQRAEQIFASVFGRAPATSQERSFLMSAATRKQGPALQGALESAQQRGQFSGAQSQQTDPIESAATRLQDVARKLQEKSQQQTTQKMRMELKTELLQNPAIQELIKLRGTLAKESQEAPTGVEPSETIRATTAGAIPASKIGSMLQRLSDVSGAIQTRGTGVNQLIENLRQTEQEEFGRLQSQFQTEQGLLSSLIQGRQEGRAQELFPLELQEKRASIENIRSQIDERNASTKSLTDLFAGASKEIQQVTGVPSFDEFLNQAQEKAQQSFGPIARAELKQQYDQQFGGFDPQSIAQQFEQGIPLSGLTDKNVAAARQQVANMLLNGDVQGAKAYVDKLVGGGGQLTETQLKSLNQVVDNVRQDQSVKDFQKVNNSFNTITRSAKLQSGPGDLALLRAFALLVDPASAVREEEFRSMETAQSTLGRLGVALTSKQVKGNRLTEGARQEFIRSANELYETHLNNYNDAIRRYTLQSEAAGIPTELTIPQIIQKQSTGFNVGDSINVGGQQARIIEILD